MTTRSDLISLVPLHAGYLCFTLDTDADLAKRTFAARFGVEPSEIIMSDMLRVGPVPEQETE